MIPTESEASLSNGIWFIHKDGKNTIQIWGSNLNGKEKVFLNNELVSEKRSTKRKSGHTFSDEDDQHYEVNFETESILKGNLKCIIKCDGIILTTFRTEYKKGRLFTSKSFLLLMLASAAIGLAKAIHGLSTSTFATLLILLIIFYYATKEKNQIIIKEE